MDWATIKPGLLAWVAVMTGLTSAKTSKPMVYWRDQPEAHRPPVYALLQTYATGSKGSDGVRYTATKDDGTPAEEGDEVSYLVPETFGNRLFTLSVEFRSLDQQHANRADVYAERLRNRIVWPRSVAMLKALNLAFVRAAPTQDISGLVDDRQESRCVLDIRFGTVIREVDNAAEGRTGFFERAALETTYEHGEDEIVVGPESYGLPEEDGP
jgi:hypothetical protein